MIDILCHNLAEQTLHPKETKPWMYSQGNIWATHDIPPSTYLGDIEGERLYADDLACDFYTPGLIFLDSDRVIDGRNCPLAHMGETTYELANCEIYIEEHTGTVGFLTMRWIQAGDCLSYWHIK